MPRFLVSTNIFLVRSSKQNTVRRRMLHRASDRQNFIYLLSNQDEQKREGKCSDGSLECKSQSADFSVSVSAVSSVLRSTTAKSHPPLVASKTDVPSHASPLNRRPQSRRMGRKGQQPLRRRGIQGSVRPDWPPPGRRHYAWPRHPRLRPRLAPRLGCRFSASAAYKNSRCRLFNRYIPKNNPNRPRL